jgi:glycosyltransferase involved in cell wall biosynthesis
MSKHKKQSRKTVSIIIPFYGQTESDLAIPLSSINNQVGVDFAKIDVHLVNDGGAPINTEKFTIFANLDVHYHELLENVGPGMARQYGIDHSEGEYLMFVDSDDELNNKEALLSFFYSIKQTGNHEVITSNFVYQDKVETFGNTFRYITHTKSNSDIFYSGVYAKWFNRKFLDKIGLQFRPELFIFEDQYFTSLALILITDIYTMEITTYLRRYNENSITHKESLKFVKDANIYVLSLRLKLRKIQEIKPDCIEETLAFNIVDIYLYQKKYLGIDRRKYILEFKALLKESPFDFEKNDIRVPRKLEKR